MCSFLTYLVYGILCILYQHGSKKDTTKMQDEKPNTAIFGHHTGLNPINHVNVTWSPWGERSEAPTRAVSAAKPPKAAPIPALETTAVNAGSPASL